MRKLVLRRLAPRRLTLRKSVRRKSVRGQVALKGMFLPGLVLAIFLSVSLVACSKPRSEAPGATADTATSTGTLASTGLESIPVADPSKYPRLTDTGDWKNPYLVVRDDGIGLVDLSNHEVHILTPEQIPAELVSLPSSAWPYGRVVLVTQATPKIPTDEAKAQVRKNRALLAGTLKDLDVQMREYP